MPTPSSAGLQVALRDVRTRQSMAEYVVDGTRPAWTEGHKFEEGNGALLLRPSDDGIVVSLGVSMNDGPVYVSVLIDGYYIVNPDSDGLTAADGEDQSFLDRTPEHLRHGLLHRASSDLFPYLREAVHAASASVHPARTPIFLGPQKPELTGKVSSGVSRHYE